MDYFTKWAEAYPMMNQEAETVANQLVNGFVTRFGVPRQIHSDQGRQFKSNLFQRLCAMLDMDKTRTTAFRPQSDGLVERFNRTLEDMLSKFVSANQKDWDIYVPLLTMAYRATPQESTHVSPNMMMLGREINLPIDIMFGNCPSNETHIDNNNYVDSLRERLSLAHDYAREQLKRSALRQKRYYDCHSSSRGFEKGQLVWLLCPHKKIGISPKLQRFWQGPFLIIEKVGDILYRIQQSPKSSTKLVHVDRLKICEGEVISSPKYHSNPEED